MDTTTHTHIGRDHYRMEVRTATLKIVADEPSDNGGTGQGFTAHQLLAAALGACTNATLRMYADRKEWPVETIDTEVAITHGESFDITNIQRSIRFTGDLDETQRARLLQIADRCPIHRTLSGTITIDTKL
ncbi:MAG: OsmC family protein, partial [Flavobacteriales bacterium]